MLLEKRPENFGKTFKSLGLNEKLLRILKEEKFKTPTEIQEKAIPLILSGKDIIACSKTGSGKTGSFVLPMIEKLKNHSKIIGTRALIIIPTRELALQTLATVKTFTKGTDIRISLVAGGYGYEGQFESLASNPDILIATPGRLEELLNDTNYSLKSVQYLVFDEGDSLFEMGFEPQIRSILRKTSDKTKRQTMLFSATIPSELKSFAMAGLNDYRLLRIDTEYQIPDKALLHFLLTRTGEKEAMLIYTLQRMIKGKVIVFCPSKQYVDFFVSLLPKFDLNCVGIFGKQDQYVRRELLSRFKDGRTNILVVTDLAARGLDIPDMLNVINFGFPQMFKTFIHRCGRTARAGRPGTIYTILSVTEEKQYFGEIISKVPKKMVNTKTGEKWDPNNAYYGRVTEDRISKVLEVVLDIIENDEELYAMREAAQNSYKKFLRSRQTASREGHVEAHELDFDGIHPLFAGDVDKDELEMLRRVKDYKPVRSYMELKAEKDQASNRELLKLVGVMKSQEAKIEANRRRKQLRNNSARKEIIKKAKELKDREEKIKIAMESSKKNRNKFKSNIFIKQEQDEENFKKMLKEDRIDDGDLEAVRLNNVSDQLFEQRKFMWDQKSKKYKKLKVDMNGNVVSEKQKVTVGEGAAQKFKRWKSKNLLGIQKEGEEENQNYADKARSLLVERTKKKRLTSLIKRKNNNRNGSSKGNKNKGSENKVKRSKVIRKGKKR